MTHEDGQAGLATQTEELDAFGHVRLGGIGDRVGEELGRLTGFDTRVTVLGHLQRGGSPTAYDRVLATRYGLLAADLAMALRYGLMASLQGADVVAVPLADAVKELKTVPREYYALAEAFFG